MTQVDMIINADMFINAFSSIFKTKVVTTYANKMKEDTAIGSNFLENKIECQMFIQMSGSLRSYKTIRAGDNKRQNLGVSIISFMFL